MATKTYSRLARVEEAKARKTAMWYAFLTLVVVLFLLFFGVRIFTAVASFLRPAPPAITENQDKTPPPPPQFNYIPQQTNTDSINITGEAEPDSIVQISVNGAVTSTRASTSGGFELAVSLVDGENSISARATDLAGNVSNQSTVITLNVDKNAPTLTVNKPTDNQSFSSTDSPTRVEGETDAVRITVNDRIAVIDSQGKFGLSITLAEGSNEITIVATDQSGNKTEQKITVNYTP